MSYSPTWSNGNPQGVLESGRHHVRLSDAIELAEAINRRRLLMYQDAQDFSQALSPGADIRRGVVAAGVAPPFDDFRRNIQSHLLGQPTKQWLWPVADADENRLLATSPGAQSVGLFEKLNGTMSWTDPSLASGLSPIRATHFNELRQAMTWLSRGRWTLPLIHVGGMYSYMPDAHWFGEMIVNDGQDELRAIFLSEIRLDGLGGQVRGLSNVTVRPSSKLRLISDTDCTVEVYACLRELDFEGNYATWNNYKMYPPAEPWAQPGGLGQGDSTLVGSVSLEADEVGLLSGPDLTAALNGMVQGLPQAFIIRRTDVDIWTASITGSLEIEFDLNSPPN